MDDFELLVLCVQLPKRLDDVLLDSQNVGLNVCWMQSSCAWDWNHGQTARLRLHKALCDPRILKLRILVLCPVVPESLLSQLVHCLSDIVRIAMLCGWDAKISHGNSERAQIEDSQVGRGLILLSCRSRRLRRLALLSSCARLHIAP
jgi:hypothetical protein